MRELPHTHSCFVCGESNPNGLKLRFVTDGRVVRARFTPKPEHVGFRGVIHGGLLATLLDEIMVWVCAVRTQQFAYCAELTVRFVSPAAPEQPLEASAELASNRRGRIFEAKSEIRGAAGALLASATGKYVPVKGADVTAMITDFVSDPSWVFQGNEAGPQTATAGV